MIAITDCTTWISQQLIESFLKKGHSVRVLIVDTQARFLLPTHLSENKSIEFVYGDVLDIPALNQLINGVDSVFHFAEIVRFNRKEKDVMYRYNVEGTANVVNVALHEKVDKLVFKSSYLALGDKSDNGLYDEETKWNDVSSAQGYSWSKHLAEREIWRGVVEGLDCLIINVGEIFGADFKYSFNKNLVEWLLDNGLFPNGKVPLIDEEDYLKILLQLFDSQTVNERVFVYSHVMSYQQLLEEISKLQNKKSKLNSISKKALKNKTRSGMFGFLKDKNRPTLNDRLLNIIADPQNYSNAKLSAIVHMNYHKADDSIKKVAKLLKIK